MAPAVANGYNSRLDLEETTELVESRRMPLVLEWPEILLRLVLTVIAGALIGINRTEQGRPAGLRTTILVCLAASVSMIQVSLLLPGRGRQSDSFIMLDLMRLPLGILTGMGFIGAGAILRKEDKVEGVTTAATLWLVTVIGLCLGGGQLGLGIATVILAIFVLWGLRRLEHRLRQDRHATLTVSTQAGSGPTEEELRNLLLSSGFFISSWDVTYHGPVDARDCLLTCEVHWRGRPSDMQWPSRLEQLKHLPGVLSLRWNA